MLLRPPSQLVSRRAPYLWTLEALVQALVLTVVLVGLSLGAPVPAWAWLPYGAVVVGYVLAMPALRYRVHRWETTGTAVYTQTGWLNQERRVAPMARVQTVDLEQGAISRLFGLADVTVTTASAAGPLAIRALDLELAVALVDELTRRAGAGDDAT